MSTIAAMDRLIVIEQGRVVEEGSHESLLARNGLYARSERLGGVAPLGAANYSTP
jgi:ABC-type multidrug transport system fused ATPase/permease subunit